MIQVSGDTALIATNQHVISTPKVLQTGSFIPGLRGRDKIALRKLQQSLAGKQPTVSVVLYSGETNEQTLKAEILGGLEEPDLAILKVSGIKAPPRPIEFAQAQQPAETLPLYILGFPFGDALATNKGNPNITIGKGSVSSVRRDAAGKIAKVQIDGALNPGNSGGPVVDAKGNLIGISVQTIQGSNIGLAIPAAELASVLDGRVGNPTVVVGPVVDGGNPTYEIVVSVIDPMNRLKSAAVQYVTGKVAIDAAQAGKPQLQSAAGATTINLAIADKTGRAALPVTPSGDKTMEITAQISYVNAQGQTVYLEPQVLRVAAPAVVTTKTDGNSTTITRSEKNSKGGTVRRCHDYARRW